MAPNDEAELTLPVEIVSLVDLGRVLHELEKLDDNLHAATLRSQDEQAMSLPSTTLLLSVFAENNKLDLAKSDDRKRALQFLRAVHTDAPKVHLSFSADPSADFLKNITRWFREKVHPTVLIAIGLQPNIGAGCVLRTQNKYFDMSLRNSLQNSQAALSSLLHSTEAGS